MILKPFHAHTPVQKASKNVGVTHARWSCALPPLHRRQSCHIFTRMLKSRSSLALWRQETKSEIFPWCKAFTQKAFWCQSTKLPGPHTHTKNHTQSSTKCHSQDNMQTCILPGNVVIHTRNRPKCRQLGTRTNIAIEVWIVSNTIPLVRLGPIHTGRGAPCNMHLQIMEHTAVNGSVHTGCRQHQRVCTQICVQICLCVLCEWGLSMAPNCKRQFYIQSHLGQGRCEGHACK